MDLKCSLNSMKGGSCDACACALETLVNHLQRTMTVL